MSEPRIVAGLLELARDMGCVIRQLDEGSDFTHFWQNDGGYVPDGRYRAGIDYEHRPDAIKYDELYEYAARNGLNYNELCAVVRRATAGVRTPDGSRDA